MPTTSRICSSLRRRSPAPRASSPTATGWCSTLGRSPEIRSRTSICTCSEAVAWRGRQAERLIVSIGRAALASLASRLGASWCPRVEGGSDEVAVGGRPRFGQVRGASGKAQPPCGGQLVLALAVGAPPPCAVGAAPVILRRHLGGGVRKVEEPWWPTR